jgi:arylsulfatase A-like enzyme
MLMEGGKTIGDQFKPAGYATAQFGKWHLGFEDKSTAPKEFVEKGDWMAPTRHGFDESFGFAEAEAAATGGKKKRI